MGHSGTDLRLPGHTLQVGLEGLRGSKGSELHRARASSCHITLAVPSCPAKKGNARAAKASLQGSQNRRLQMFSIISILYMF